MPVWEIELSDGRIVDVESDTEPTLDALLPVLKQYEASQAASSEFSQSTDAPLAQEAALQQSLTPEAMDERRTVDQPFDIARVAEPEPFNPIQAEAVMNTPLVSPEALKAISPMSRILPPDSLAGGYERGLREIISGVTTPAALSIAPAFTVPYLAPAAGMVFGAKTLGESAGRLTEAQTPAEAGGALAGVVVGTGMVAGGAPGVRRAAAEATPAGRLAYELREAQMSPAGLPTTAQVREAGLREAAMPEAVRMTQRALEARAKQILSEMEAPKPTPERPLRSEDVTVKTRPKERIEDAPKAVEGVPEAAISELRQELGITRDQAAWALTNRDLSSVDIVRSLIGTRYKEAGVRSHEEAVQKAVVEGVLALEGIAGKYSTTQQTEVQDAVQQQSKEVSRNVQQPEVPQEGSGQVPARSRGEEVTEARVAPTTQEPPLQATEALTPEGAPVEAVAEPASAQSVGIAPEGSELIQGESIQESKPFVEEAVSEMPGMEKGEVADALTDPNQAPILDVPPIEAQSGINPKAPIKAANVLAGAAGEQWTTFVDNMLVNMIDRVERGGTPFHRTVAEDARQAVNATKRIQGRLREPYLNALRASAGGLSPARHKAVMDLARPIRTASGHQTTLMQEVLNKRQPLEILSKDQKPVVRSYQDFLNAIAEILEEVGFKVLDSRFEGGSRPFKPSTDGRVFLRLINHDFYEMLYHGGAKLAAFAEHVASHPANAQAGWTNEKLMEQYQGMRDDFINSSTPEAAFRRINAEIPRELPFFPTHYRDPVTGFNLEMLHVRPFDIAQRIMETVSHRAGFVEHFGQSISPENNRVKEIMEFMRKNPGQAREFTDMSRALNAQPVESTQLFEPGSKSAMVARVVNLTLSALKAHMLGVSTAPNIPEPLGRIQAQGTVPDVMKALWKVVGPGREAYIAALEELGATAIGDDIIDLTIDPARPIESLQRIHNDLIGRAYLYRFFWRFQHRLAAAVANEMVGRIASGKGLDRDVPVLMSSMNLSRKEAERLVSGKATKEELDAFTRRAGAFTTNQPQLGAEMSRAEKAKWFRLAFAFTQYGMMSGRHVTREMMTIFKTGKESKWGFSGDKKANAQMRGAMTNFLKTLLGGTMAGSLTTLMLAFLTGGKEGLEQKVREMEDEPVQFFRDSLLYFMLAGPYGAVLRTTKFSRGNAIEDVASYTFPGVMFLELNDMIKGSGRYRSATTATQKAGLLIDRFLPAKRVWTAALAGFGFGGGTKAEHLKLKQDISAYWRWRNDNDPLPKGQFPPPADFTRQMRQAYEKLLKGDEDAIEQIYRAMDVYDRTPSEARRSLLSRRLLTRYEGNPELWESLQERIGEDAMQTLMAHDALLEGMARSFR